MNLPPEKFSLKWNDFENNIKTTFRLVKNNEDFTDVTLCVEDNQQFEAHRVVLAGGSDFFRDILKQSKHPHPFIYLKGVERGQLEAILDFCYLGEASVAEADISSFFKVAQELKVKGLAEGVADKNISTNGRNERNMIPSLLESRRGGGGASRGVVTEELVREVAPAYDSFQPEPQQQALYTQFKTEPYVEDHAQTYDIEESIEVDLHHDAYEGSAIVETTFNDNLPATDPNRPFFCEKCWKNFKSKASLKDHISWVHTGPDIVYTCPICGKTDMTKKGLANHKYIKHSENKGIRAKRNQVGTSPMKSPSNISELH